MDSLFACIMKYFLSTFETSNSYSNQMKNKKAGRLFCPKLTQPLGSPWRVPPATKDPLQYNAAIFYNAAMGTGFGAYKQKQQYIHLVIGHFYNNIRERDRGTS